MSMLSMRITVPALLFTSVLPAINLPLLARVWPMFIFPALYASMGALFGWVVILLCDPPEDFRRGTIAAIAFGNSTGAPLPPRCREGGGRASLRRCHRGAEEECREGGGRAPPFGHGPLARAARLKRRRCRIIRWCQDGADHAACVLSESFRALSPPCALYPAPCALAAGMPIA
eukprot:1836288-Prymnesium_polylepis.1